jgi:hypothetical protein
VEPTNRSGLNIKILNHEPEKGKNRPVLDLKRNAGLNRVQNPS